MDIAEWFGDAKFDWLPAACFVFRSVAVGV
jgi:hypothetical protein